MPNALFQEFEDEGDHDQGQRISDITEWSGGPKPVAF